MSELKRTQHWFKTANRVDDLKAFTSQMNCFREEVDETIHAYLHEDPQELIDGLCDTIVTCVGMLHLMQVDAEEALKRINDSNFSKFNNGNPEFSESGKIMKSANFKPPVLEDLVVEEYMLTKPKLLIIGNDGAGKSTVAQILNDEYLYLNVDSSLIAAEVFVQEYLEDKFGLKFTSSDDCYRSKHLYREKWVEAFNAYNAQYPTRFMDYAYRHSAIYTGLRDRDTFELAKEEELFSLVIWVDNGDTSSVHNELSSEDADVVIRNTGDLEHLREQVADVFYNHICTI